VPTALVTGGSAGLGRALTAALVAAGWDVVTDARGAPALERTAAALGPRVHALPGDVGDEHHRAELVDLVTAHGGPDLLVHNASTLGASPLRRLADLTPEIFADVWRTNVAAPLALTRALLPALRERRGVVVAISSDAAVASYEGWGGYGAAKAALDHLTLTLAAEEPSLACYAVDPGDMRTAMHQDAFPGEDISDRPEPETVVPALLALLAARPPSGRYRAADLVRSEASPPGAGVADDDAAGAVVPGLLHAAAARPA
jgi:NAD(P)-dependent dehydrogenase (short-subunit alcohol dehydrogenase family)